MSKQAKGTGRHWYVVHTYAGYEDAVKEALLQRIESLGMQDYIFDVTVPKESKIVIKKNEPQVEQKKIFPGYVFVDMVVTDDSWYVVRNTPNVTGFVGSSTIPVPVSEDEFGLIKKRMGVEEAKYKIDIVAGDPVIILEGPFANYDGIVEKVDEDKGHVRVMISFLGRETPVELDFTQVRKK